MSSYLCDLEWKCELSPFKPETWRHFHFKRTELKVYLFKMRSTNGSNGQPCLEAFHT